MDIKLLLSSLLIIISFFCWYLFWDNINKKKLTELENKDYYVNIIQKNKKLELNSDKNIIIKLNWELFNSWSISLE